MMNDRLTWYMFNTYPYVGTSKKEKVQETWYIFNAYLYVDTSEKEKVHEKERKQPAQTRRKKGETTTNPPKKEPVPISYV